MNNEVLARNEVYATMEGGEPYASYTKTILGQVAVTVWDNVLEKPVDVILRGDPKKRDADSIVNVWSAKEDSFFKRVNRNHFSKGLVIPFQSKEPVVEEKTIEQATDEELLAIVNLKYIAFTNKLNKIDSIPVLFRMKLLAQEADKSEKITSAIEKRISEVQSKEFTVAKGEVEEE